MTTTVVSFDAKDDKGNNPGDYEMFVDVHSGDSVQIRPPAGYTVNGIKMYRGTDSGGVGQGGPFTPNPQKGADKTTLKSGNPNNDPYREVFVTNASLDGFTYTPADGDTPATLTDASAPGANLGGFEFLIWLVRSADGSNDFADPGIRNRG